MPTDFHGSGLQIVIKISKYCNLRCSYCYEFPNLGDKSLMSIPNLEKLFRNLATFQRNDQLSADSEEDTFSFIWHGGEPLLVKLAYYDEIGAIQRNVINSDLSYHNSVQTNLTVLNKQHIDHIREKRFFDKVGFSFDVYGDQRLDVKGRPSNDRVLVNLQKLIDNGIETAGITVLSRTTLPHIKSTYEFFNGIGLNFRMLPYHIETDAWQTDINGLQPSEIVSAMCEVFDMWFRSERPIFISPLDGYINNAISYLNRGQAVYFNKISDESIFIVDTNGDTNGYETYGQYAPYGNLFDQSFEEILQSQGRLEAAKRAANKVEKYCAKCPYFGACSGYPVAESNEMEERWLETEGCYVAKIISHIVVRLDASGVGNLQKCRVSMPLGAS